MSAVVTKPVTDLITYRVERLEDTVGEIRDCVKSIDNSQKTLASAVAEHAVTQRDLAHVTTELKALTEKVHAIELELPTLRMVRGWVIAGVVGMASILGYAVFTGVLK